MTGTAVVLLTTFLASAVEAIEMVIIVLGVGTTRGWRSTLLGAAAGSGLLVATVALLGLALTAIPIGPLRVLVGALLLMFGLQWYRKGIVRVAVRGLAGMQTEDFDDTTPAEVGIDWTAFVLAFKGVLLEGLEVAFIVVTFGATAGQIVPAILAGAAAIVVIGAAGFAAHRSVSRIPRSLLQLIVGTLLTTFGTFWALEGLGVSWPQSDIDILGLLAFYSAGALTLTARQRWPRQRLAEVAS